MIRHGDLFDVLPTLADASIDACVTDPPYGIGFMGKQWDTFKPGIAETRIVPNRQIDSDNPNLKGRTRGPASSPSAVEYDYSVKGLRGFQEWTERWAREVFRVLKPGAYLLVCGAPRSYHRMGCGLEDAGFEIRDCLQWLFGSGFPKSLNVGDGRGTALKPAWEPIVLARKPFKGSVVANLEQHGTGALNIDACRIAWLSDEDKESTARANTPGSGRWVAQSPFTAIDNYAVRPNGAYDQPQLGRWPANVLLDEQAAALLDQMSGELTSGGYPPEGGLRTRVSVYGEPSERGPQLFGSSSGGASRFFYVAKPSRAERDKGCYGLPEKTPMELTGRKEGSAGLKHGRAGTDAAARNYHPTVKPIELMRYLVRLVTPIDGVVLDPFCGSGTTGMACRFEGRKFIGIEREAEYVAIAERRIADCLPLFDSEAVS